MTKEEFARKIAGLVEKHILKCFTDKITTTKFEMKIIIDGGFVKMSDTQEHFSISELNKE
ncbi:MAG: hypothetical protein KBS62_00270 [Oscillospiraceae bacterium]|nr:hypothetical protein [Candidatus Ruminococcus equi]